MSIRTGADDLIKIEDFRASRPKRSSTFSDGRGRATARSRSPRPTRAEDAFILEGFEAYLDTLDVSLNWTSGGSLQKGFAFCPCGYRAKLPRKL